LGLDQGAGQGVEKWTAILNKLPPYLINEDGAMAEWSWPGLQDHYNHRHSSGLLPVWPFREITPENNLALFNAARMTLQTKDAFNYENAGHGLLHSALIAANLKNAQSVTVKLMRLTKEDYYYNSLISSHYNNHGVFCTDTCNAVPGIMIEMLVCSSPGVLELLPALPQSLTQGAISDVKGRNRVTVENLSWDMKSNSVDCTLKSDIDQNITLIERDGINSINTSATVSASPIGQIARTIQLQAGVSTHVSIGLGQLRPLN
jgi:alpha-L-fucosidase 2